MPEGIDATAKTFLVFGDVHGRILPAFRLAACWARDFHRPLAGILQVGDLGYFPDASRLDRATIRHAASDPLEMGAQDVVTANPLADGVFDDPYAAEGLWFTAGNHEDFGELERLAGGSGGRGPDFAVDHYARVRGIKDGRVAELAGGMRVGAVWGVDGDGRNARQNLPRRGYIRGRAVDELLAAAPFDVLLSHDAPADAKRFGYGSERLRHLIELARPAFAFFGHYGGEGRRVDEDFGGPGVYHMGGFELRERDGAAEPGSVGVLTWAAGAGAFEYVAPHWLKSFTRYNWKWR